MSPSNIKGQRREEKLAKIDICKLGLFSQFSSIIHHHRVSQCRVPDIREFGDFFFRIARRSHFHRLQVEITTRKDFSFAILLLRVIRFSFSL